MVSAIRASSMRNHRVLALWANGKILGFESMVRAPVARLGTSVMFSRYAAHIKIVN